MEPLPTLNKVFFLILQFEREISTADKESGIQTTIASFFKNNPNYLQGGTSSQGGFNNGIHQDVFNNTLQV